MLVCSSLRTKIFWGEKHCLSMPVTEAYSKSLSPLQYDFLRNLEMPDELAIPPACH